ncbi:Scd6-like Sm domain-containing protein [Zopfochytrium polystomum]|nr:Scd6-like Sm domain-containing protein [Zopfochytrium polystomum]
MAFVGSTISLISKSDIRYVGVLHSINQQESTVALQNWSFGTEDRRDNPAERIPHSQHIFEYIVFRGSDIKDLQVVNAPAAPLPPQVPNDPAILQARGGPPQSSGWSQPSGYGPPATPAVAAGWSNPPMGRSPSQGFASPPSATAQGPSSRPQVDNVTSKLESLELNGRQPSKKAATQETVNPKPTVLASRPPRPAAAPKTDVGGPGPRDAKPMARQESQGSHYSHSQGQQGPRPPRNPSQRGGRGSYRGRGGGPRRGIPVPASDYDFESANAKFDKSAVASSDAAETPAEPQEFYNKKNFFDDISCEAKDRANGERRNLRHHEERKLNLETFGQASIDGNRSGYRRGGGGGGRGRGGGPRTYHNNGANNETGNAISSAAPTANPSS